MSADETAQPVTLTREEREEAKRVIQETYAIATARAAAGRSSMPIYLIDAALLLGLAAVAVDLIPEQETATATPVIPPEEVQWAVRAENGVVARASEEVARAAITKGGYTLNGSPIVAALTRAIPPEHEWVEYARVADAQPSEQETDHA